MVTTLGEGTARRARGAVEADGGDLLRGQGLGDDGLQVQGPPLHPVQPIQ